MACLIIIVGMNAFTNKQNTKQIKLAIENHNYNTKRT